MPRVNTVRYLTLSKGDVTGRDVLAALDALATAQQWKPGKVKKYRSIVTRALEEGTGASGDAMLTARVNHVLLDLPHYAGRVGCASSWADNRATAKRYLESVTGLTRAGVTRKLKTEDRWSTALGDLAAASARPVRNALQRFERVMLAAGYKLADPMDRDSLMKAAASLGIKSTAKDITNYRAARERLIACAPSAAARFGPVEHAPYKKAVGLRTVPNLGDLLQVAGYKGHADDLTPFEQACYLWPTGGDQLKEYLETGRTKPRRNRPSRPVKSATKEDAQRRFCLIVAQMCKYDDAALLLRRDFGLDRLFLDDRPNIHAHGIGSSKSAFAYASAPGVDTVPLLQYLFDRSLGDRAWQSAYRDLFEAATPDSSGPRYMPAMLGQLETLWTVVRAGFAPVVTPAQMLALKTRHRAMRDTMRMCAAQATADLSAKDKALAVQTVTYDQAVCYILPALALEVGDAKQAYYRAVTEAERTSHDPWRDADCRRRRRDWHDRALSYLALALPLADGKRLAQYTHGRLGFAEHIRPAFRDGKAADGELLTLVCRWTRNLTDPAGLKDPVAGGLKPLARVTHLNPAIISYEILTDWIRELRTDDLVAAKLVSSREAYSFVRDMAEGRWAFFVSPKRDTPSSAHGRTDLSEIMGMALYDGCRRFLGRDLPPWDQRVEAGYRAIFAEHIARLLIVSALGGVYGLWAEAARMLDDFQSTCESEYTAIVEEALVRSGEAWDSSDALRDVLLPRLSFGPRGRSDRSDVLSTLLSLDDAAPGTRLPAPLRAILVARRGARRDRISGRRQRKLGPRKRSARPHQSSALRAAKGKLGVSPKT